MVTNSTPNIVVSYSISTSNHNTYIVVLIWLTVVSYSISTSNHNFDVGSIVSSGVVSYSISTSNHNQHCTKTIARLVVSYSISTSNHNHSKETSISKTLYLIPFLHQTTTRCRFVGSSQGCILFHFYIKPQPYSVVLYVFVCCILFHFYIKPQRYTTAAATLFVVSYSISTSNHNVS